MGLDMYLGRYHRPDITKEHYNAEETESLKDWNGNYNVFNSLPDCFKGIAKNVTVTNQYYNMEKISQDFANGEPLTIDGYGCGKIYFRNYEKDIKLDLPFEEIHKNYLTAKEETAYVVQGEYEVAYWRKANQIRQWFVDHIKEFYEVDNGEYYKVTKELLYDLINDCKLILIASEEDREAAAREIIPTSSGFFFGSTEYDEWYYKDLENTIEQCQKVIDETDWENEIVVYTESW